MQTLIGWIGLLAGFSGLIFVHELGHFVFAKWNGVDVQVFSIGMGPYLFSFTYRGTVYALSLIPMGGYVKMLGQDDLNADPGVARKSGDFRSKRPGQRAAILVGGAFFNVLLTIVLFAVCFYAGRDIDSPRLGNIAPDKPLAHATIFDAQLPEAQRMPAMLKPGDRVLEVNSVPVKSFMDMLQLVASSATDDITLRVERQNAVPKLVYVTVTGVHDKARGMTDIGLEKPYEEEISLPLGFSTELQTIVLDDVKAKEAPKEGAPAVIPLLKGDRILALEDRTDPAHPVSYPMDTPSSLPNAAAATGGKPRVFVIERTLDGKTTRLDVPRTPTRADDESGYKFGLAFQPFKKVIHIDPECAAYKAGLREGDFAVGFNPDNSKLPWTSGTLMWVKTLLDTDVKEAKIQVPDVTLPNDQIYKQDRFAQELYKSGTPGEAIGEAWEDTRRYTFTIFSTLRGLFTGKVAAKNLSGPYGIGKMIFTVAVHQSFVGYLWWMAYISLQLGVMQLLPIPILDGFHLVLVGIEKIKGSAVSAKVQERLLYLGLALIGSLFLFVMFHDLTRKF